MTAASWLFLIVAIPAACRGTADRESAASTHPMTSAIAISNGIQRLECGKTATFDRRRDQFMDPKADANLIWEARVLPTDSVEVSGCGACPAKHTNLNERDFATRARTFPLFSKRARKKNFPMNIDTGLPLTAPLPSVWQKCCAKIVPWERTRPFTHSRGSPKRVSTTFSMSRPRVSWVPNRYLLGQFRGSDLEHDTRQTPCSHNEARSEKNEKPSGR
jgi:hypothetical protein